MIIETINQQATKQPTMNHDLLSEVVFTNDKAFSDVDIDKAKMMLCVCKNAKQNKNIQWSIDDEKIKSYCKQITTLTSKKANYMLNYFAIRKLNGESVLDITKSYKARVMKIVKKLLNEDSGIIEAVKEEVIAEQRRNIDKYIVILEKIVSNHMIYDEIDEDDHILEECNKNEIVTIFKYNSYILNMITNHEKNNEIIMVISSEHFHNTWWHTKQSPFIFID